MSWKVISNWIIFYHILCQIYFFIFSLIFLFLEIQMVGVTAMASSQARPGPMKLNTSKRVARRLMRNTIMLKRKAAMKPLKRRKYTEFN